MRRALTVSRSPMRLLSVQATSADWGTPGATATVMPVFLRISANEAGAWYLWNDIPSGGAAGEGYLPPNWTMDLPLPIIDGALPLTMAMVTGDGVTPLSGSIELWG